MKKHFLLTFLLGITLVFAPQVRIDNRLLDDSEIPTPPRSPRLVIAHGCSRDDVPFQVPKNTHIITFAPLGEGLDMRAASDPVLNALKDFYAQGSTLFKNNDTTEDLTNDGKSLVDSIGLSFPPKNHLPGQDMNNMNLSFGQKMSERIGEFELRDFQPSLRMKKEGESSESTLKTYAEENKGRTIFVFACRKDDHIPEPQRALMRQLSGSPAGDIKSRAHLAAKIQELMTTNQVLQELMTGKAEIIGIEGERLQVRLGDGSEIKVRLENLV